MGLVVIEVVLGVAHDAERAECAGAGAQRDSGAVPRGVGAQKAARGAGGFDDDCLPCADDLRAQAVIERLAERGREVRCPALGDEFKSRARFVKDAERCGKCAGEEAGAFGDSPEEGG